MDRTTWDRIEDLFITSIELDGESRVAFLDQACAGKPDLRIEIEAMLAAHEDDRALRLERVLAPDAAEPGSEAGLIGRRIGVWKVKRLLGRGGMAEVWLAIRDDGQYEQMVALKLLKPGWRSADLTRRFRRERQLLARLEHPNIAKLLDGGVTDTGVPYLAMEYVDGVAITDWCRAGNLTLAGTLSLFATVCNAVNAAHANLVVHRDLKPSNILVTPEGRPSLLDFGIAKLLDPDEEGAPLTREADRLLTPEYASPEQLRGEAVTTQADVWGLGVLLHELLTGCHPFSVSGFATAKILHTIEREENHRPASSVAPEGFRGSLRGDLDRIIMKALRPLPVERYRSVEEFSQDLKRWQAGLPISAQPDSFRYRTTKFLRRNRVPVTIGATVAVLVLGFGGIAAWQARRASSERDVAIAEREKSDRVLGLLVDLFEASNPTVVPGGDTLRVTDFLKLGEQKIDALGDQPQVQFRLWETMAAIHGARSRYAEEGAAIDRALLAGETGRTGPDLRRLRHKKALNVARIDGAAAAEPLLRESLATHERDVGPDHPEVATVLCDLAETVPDPAERLQLLDRSMVILRAQSRPDSLSLATTFNSLGIHYWKTQDVAWARDSFADALRFLPAGFSAEHPHRLDLMNNLASCTSRLGRFEEAWALHAQLFDARRRIQGDSTVAVARSQQNLGVIAANLGRHDEAVVRLREALRIYELRFGGAHLETGLAARNLGLELARTGADAEADILLDRSERIIVDQEGNDSATLAHGRSQRLALRLVRGLENPAEALRVVVGRLEAEYPDGHAHTAEALVALGASVLEIPGAEAGTVTEAAFTRAIDLYRKAGLSGHPALAQAECGLSVARSVNGRDFDLAGTGRSLAACEKWGLAFPTLIDRTRKLAASRP